jgi:hypothetical protein
MALAAADGNRMPSISLYALDNADSFVLSLENRTLLWIEVSLTLQINRISSGIIPIWSSKCAAKGVLS